MNHITFSAEHKRRIFQESGQIIISFTFKVNHEDLWVRFGASHEHQHIQFKRPGFQGSLEDHSRFLVYKHLKFNYRHE